MNATYFHLLLNHFPIIGTLIGASTLLYGVVKKESKIKSLAVFIIASIALVTILVYFAGEFAGDTVEKTQGVLKTVIEAHEEAADIAMLVMLITGALSLFTIVLIWLEHSVINKYLVVIKYNFSDKFYSFILFFSIISLVLMVRVGYYGGKIRHTEFNSTTNIQLPQGEN